MVALSIIPTVNRCSPSKSIGPCSISINVINIGAGQQAGVFQGQIAGVEAYEPFACGKFFDHWVEMLRGWLRSQSAGQKNDDRPQARKRRRNDNAEWPLHSIAVARFRTTRRFQNDSFVSKEVLNLSRRSQTHTSGHLDRRTPPAKQWCRFRRD